MVEVCCGDTVIVESISRLESIDTTTPTGKFVLTIFGAIYELERMATLQKSREGIAAARLRGVKFGRPIKTPPENFGELVKKWERGEISFLDLKEQTGLTEPTLYRRLREFRLTRK